MEVQRRSSARYSYQHFPTSTRSPASRNRRASASPRPLVLPVTSTLYCRLAPSAGSVAMPVSVATALVTARAWRRERVVRTRVSDTPAREAPAASAMGAILYGPGWRGDRRIMSAPTAASKYKSTRGSIFIQNPFGFDFRYFNIFIRGKTLFVTVSPDPSPSYGF